MSLTKKLLNLGTSALVGWNVLTLNPGLEIPPAPAQTNLSCEQIIEKHETKLKGSFWGLGSGCLDEFQPDRADKSDYNSSFSCVKDFLGEYDEKKCGRSELYNNSIEAMLRNLFVKNKTVTTGVRIILRNEGVLDHRKQLEDIAKVADRVEEKIKTAERSYPEADLAQRKVLRRKVDSWRNYLNDLRVQAVLVTDQALFLRERPERYELKEIDEDTAEGINLSRETFNDLISLEGHLARKDWENVYHDFKKWKKDQEDVYERLISTQEKALQFGLFEVEKYTGKWKNVIYLDDQGKWQTTWVSEEFAGEWGDNGEKFYEKIEEIDGVIAKVEKVDLKKIPIVKKDEPKIAKSKTRARALEKVVEEKKGYCGNSPLTGHYLWNIGEWSGSSTPFSEDCTFEYSAKGYKLEGLYHGMDLELKVPRGESKRKVFRKRVFKLTLTRDFDCSKATWVSYYTDGHAEKHRGADVKKRCEAYRCALKIDPNIYTSTTETEEAYELTGNIWFLTDKPWPGKEEFGKSRIVLRVLNDCGNKL